MLPALHARTIRPRAGSVAARLRLGRNDPATICWLAAMVAWRRGRRRRDLRRAACRRRARDHRTWSTQCAPPGCSWLLVLQAGTYVAQAGVWRVVLHRAGASVPFRLACRLSLAKLFIDQAVPTMGVSGAALVARGLGSAGGRTRDGAWRRSRVDAASFYIAYVLESRYRALILAWPRPCEPADRHGRRAVLLLRERVDDGRPVADPAAAGAARRERLRRIARRRPARRAACKKRDQRLVRTTRRCWRRRNRPGRCAIVLLDAATLWMLLRALGAKAGAGGVFASFMIAACMRTHRASCPAASARSKPRRC